jgi:uncharacterized glyoxalase superfamily protein PhnB
VFVELVTVVVDEYDPAIAFFEATYDRLATAGVHFVRPPRDEPYGRVAVFLDIAGNRWDLLGPRPAAV